MREEGREYEQMTNRQITKAYVLRWMATFVKY